METHRWTRRLVKVSGRAGSLVDRQSPSSTASVMGGAFRDGCHASVGRRGAGRVCVESHPRQWTPSGAPTRTANAPPGNPCIHRTLPVSPCGGCPVLHTGRRPCEAVRQHLPHTMGPPHPRDWEGILRCTQCEGGKKRRGRNAGHRRPLHLLHALTPLRVRVYSALHSQSSSRWTCSARLRRSTRLATSPFTVPFTPPSHVSCRTSCPCTRRAVRK